jgi:hypothetical protein
MNPPPTFATLDEVAYFVKQHRESAVLAPTERRADLVAFLRQTLTSDSTAPQSPDEWRAAVIAGLQERKQQALIRVAAARDAGAVPDPFDRDVAGWLASGLVDLLEDPVTGESFRRPSGAFERLAIDANASFTEADFTRPADLRFLEAARPAQAMMTKLSLASTSQYREAAARLANRVLAERTKENVVFLDDPAQRHAVSPNVERLVGIGEAFAAWPNVCRFDDAPAPLNPMFIIEQALREEGILADGGESVEIEQAWRTWFAAQLDQFNSDELLLIEEFTEFEPLIERTRQEWGNDQVPVLKLPTSRADVQRVKAFFARIKEMRDMERLINTDYAEMAIWRFDQAIKAGTATLDLLEPETWEMLEQQGRDLSRYRIVYEDPTRPEGESSSLEG